jgi:molybdopterin adenylyltransferase
MQIRAAVLTVSDTRTAENDISGKLLAELLTGIGAEICQTVIVRDEISEISREILEFAQRSDVNLILTTGGTGLSPGDVTPEATRAVIDKEIPGIPEAMRLSTLAKTEFAMLSRSVAGICRQTLVINLPGSPKAVKECFDVIRPILSHAVKIVAGGGHD